ncbi:hypothetical protein RCH09_002917 [Actimicrobium sp. GrIS 1.19]|uniref:FxDxF family PEP-CTERM protein n=1 Tax=Actimicrobium sp. GrIS 1.19 TaxID=3071708 RepID=UPI002DFC408B|nr:hypothetical protein [Actimicrobium sp. GrIS 1.19]
MFKHSVLKRTMLAAVIAVSGFAASAAHADYSFDFSQANSLTKYADVSFGSANLEDILDANFDKIGQHWVVDPAYPAFLSDMSLNGYNGTAAAGVTGLNALDAPILMHFNAPVSIYSFLLKQDNSAYGFPGPTNLTFLNANGEQIGSSVDYIQNAVTSISAGPLSQQISGVVLSSGKFYTSRNVITAVPEPETYAMPLAGLALLGVAARRRKS